MGYTRMTFLQFHRLIHSHSMSQSDYRYSLSSYGFGCYGTGTRLGGVLEIGFVEENPLVFHFPELGERLTVQVDDIFIIPPSLHAAPRRAQAHFRGIPHRLHHGVPAPEDPFRAGLRKHPRPNRDFALCDPGF